MTHWTPLYEAGDWISDAAMWNCCSIMKKFIVTYFIKVLLITVNHIDRELFIDVTKKNNTIWTTIGSGSYLESCINSQKCYITSSARQKTRKELSSFIKSFIKNEANVKEWMIFPELFFLLYYLSLAFNSRSQMCWYLVISNYDRVRTSHVLIVL